MQVPKRKSEQFIKRDSGPYMVTAQALRGLEEELARLEKELPPMIKEVERTKEFGDFSENAAYQDAKFTLRKTHGRIASIKDRLKRAVIIEKDLNSKGTIQIGSVVVVETNNKRLEFEILGHHETDPANGIISDRSPLGKALLNRSVGDKIFVQLKDRAIEYKILEIR